MSSRKKLGLALGCGASRGWAHIGIIEALDDANIPIDIIAGCSVGAYIGAIYASGGLNSLKEFLFRMNGKKIFSYFDVAFSRSGILNGTKRVTELFSMHTTIKNFEDLRIPLAMVATDLERGEKVVLKSGNIINALRATMSYPGLFAPVQINGCWLVDGGIVDPVPVGVARAMGADIVIAVDLNTRIVSRQKNTSAGHPDTINQPVSPEALEAEQNERGAIIKKIFGYYEAFETNIKNKKSSTRQNDSLTPDIIETITTSINIMEERISRINLAVDRPDILIQPRLGELKMMNFDRVAHAIEEGYIGVQEKLLDIQTLLASR
ncbi:patatin-like phospholipase family protein [Desulfopila aestuarii]|uniref:NTE family protein n=1 Tax=Desulfopila aestuarii DSM 18488 TaxID=1121416 RepID=A0A1M7YKV6_9BACT|nr:patatin-like phospholipase family protein [Desulfopila aestuarii]SHO53196.1 NTE family protein [Desulfopila aestuarii DSM 18488]